MGPRARFGAAAVGSCIFAVGGVDRFESPLRSVEKLDVSLEEEEPSWSLVEALPIPLCDHAVVALKGCLYVLGGRSTLDNREEIVGSVYRYDVDRGGNKSLGQRLEDS